jgi:hypothetical protein
MNIRVIPGIGVVMASLTGFLLAAESAVPQGASQEQAAKQDKGITVKCAKSVAAVDMVKVYDARSLASTWYEDGSPAGMPRPTFSPSTKTSLFLAVRAKLRIGMEFVKLSGVRLVDTANSKYEPLAFKIGATNEFSFSYPDMWYSARRWTTIEFQHSPGSPTYDKMLILKEDKDAPLCLDLIYEIPENAKELTLTIQR